MSPAGTLPITIALLAALSACAPRPPSPPIVLHPPAPARERVVLHRPAARPARPNRAIAAANRAAPAEPAEPAELSATEREDLLRDFDAYLNKSAPTK